MAKKFEQYRMQDRKTRLSESYFNPIWRSIDNRINSLESIGKDWNAAIREVSQFGLRRINTLLEPAFNRLQGVLNLGATRVHTGTVTWQTGVQTISVPADDEAQIARIEDFAPGATAVLIRESDADHYLFGPILDWRVNKDSDDNITGAELDVDVQTAVGAPADGDADDAWVLTGPAADAFVKTLGFRDAAQMAASSAQDALDAAGLPSDLSGHATDLLSVQSDEQGYTHVTRSSVVPVNSVAGKTGSVSLGPGDVKLGNVPNEDTRETWDVKSANFTARLREHYAVDTSGGAVTATLPSNPASGDPVHFADSARSWGTNAFTVDGNGNNILGASTFTADVKDWPFSIVFNGTQWVFGSRG